MRLLLDTHIFLWAITESPKLGPKLRALIADETNAVFVSVVSLWELLIKNQIGKLTLPEKPAEFLIQERAALGIDELPLREDAMLTLGKLPMLHRDPFDRILAAQALADDLTVVTVDEKLTAYPIPSVTQ